MKRKKKARPGVLIRMTYEDLAELNRQCANECTPRENWCRRLILEALRKKKPPAK